MNCGPSPRRASGSLHVRRALRALSAAAVAAVALVALAAPASAHALLRSSDPAAGAVLDSAPATVSATFTEPPDPVLSQMDVLDAQGHSVAAGPAKVVAGRPKTMRVPLQSSLRDGVYTVQWRTTSTADGHTTNNFFSFGVGVSPAGAAAPPGAEMAGPHRPSAASVAGRWLLYSGLALLVATMTMRFLVLRGSPPRARAVLVSAWAAAAVGLVIIAAAESAAADVSLHALLASATGTALIRQGIAILLAGVAVAFAARRPTDVAFAAVGATAAVALLFHSLAGHAGAAASWRPFNVAVQWLHLLAVGVWIGGLLWLLLDLRSQREDRDDRIRRFSALAGSALAVVLITGVLRAVDLIGGWTRLGRALGTGWGDALLWKLGLFAGLVGIAAWNRYVNVRHLDDPHAGSLKRFVGAEAILAAGVFGVTGVLAGLPPPAQLDQAPSSPAAITVTRSDFATTTRAQLVIAPGAVGSNSLRATVTDYDTHRPVPATRVAVRTSLPSRPDLGSTTVDLHRTGPGVWAAQSSALSLQGRWSLVVVVQTETGSTEVPFSIAVRAPPAPTAASSPSAQRTSVSRAPGQPDIYTVTLADGSSVQAYLDPARPGLAEVHFTAFAPSGQELPLATATATATSPAGEHPLKLRRLDQGHFVGDVKLVSGMWTFSLDARASTGASLSAAFHQEVP
jgi:copper transport protein